MALDIYPKGVALAMFTGIFGLLGALCFITAVDKGKLSVVVTVTALYPVISLTLAFLILKEPVSLMEIVGMILALVAIVLLSISSGHR